MASTVARGEIVEVFLSDKRVVASEAESVIPKGYRQATLEEVTLRYRHDVRIKKCRGRDLNPSLPVLLRKINNNSNCKIYLFH